MAVLQSLCTAPSSEHTALAHKATLHGTRQKSINVRINHTGPATRSPSARQALWRRVATLPDSVAPERVHDKTRTHVSRHHSVQRKGNAKRARANTFRYASLVLLLGLPRKPATNTSERYLFRVPNHDHACWPEAICPQLGPHKPVMPTKSSFQHEGLIHLSFRNQQSHSRRYCTSEKPGPVRTPPLQKAKSDPRSRWSNQHRWSSFQSLVIFRRGSPQPLWIPSDFPVLWAFGLLPLRSGASGKTCLGGCPAHCPELIHGEPGSHPIGPCAVHGEKRKTPKLCTEPMNRSNSKQHSLPKPPSKHQGS